MGSGDYGETDVMGMRVKKTSDVIMLNALIDEINAIAGVIRSYDKRLDKKLLYIENINSLISSNISGYTGDDKIEDITADITMMIKNSSAINTKKFVFFGEDRTSSLLNLIRT
jgi:cob(I)alamin adenosyltransferase